MSTRPISKRTLLAAGFTEYDARKNVGDPHCVGFFQKELRGGTMLDVSLWKFPRQRGLQVNFEALAVDRELHLDIGMRGVPKAWTVTMLEAYVVALLERIRRPHSPRPRRST